MNRKGPAAAARRAERLQFSNFTAQSPVLKAAVGRYMRWMGLRCSNEGLLLSSLGLRFETSDSDFHSGASNK